VIPIDRGSGDDTRISSDLRSFIHHRRKQSQADSTRKASKQIAAQTKSWRKEAGERASEHSAFTSIKHRENTRPEQLIYGISQKCPIVSSSEDSNHFHRTFSVYKFKHWIHLAKQFFNIEHFETLLRIIYKISCIIGLKRSDLSDTLWQAIIETDIDRELRATGSQVLVGNDAPQVELRISCDKRDTLLSPFSGHSVYSARRRRGTTRWTLHYSALFVRSICPPESLPLKKSSPLKSRSPGIRILPGNTWIS